VRLLALWGKKKSLAGLFVFGDKMQYLALDGKRGSLSVKAMVEVGLDMAPTQRDVWSDLVALEGHLLKLKKEMGGKWPGSAVLGIQSKDVMVKVVQVPRMDERDMKEAFKFEFDKHFPFPSQEAVFDLAMIDHPLDSGGETAFAVAAASRSRPVESFLQVCNKAGLMIQSVEPSAVAMLRALQGPDVPPEPCNLYVMAGFHTSLIVIAYKDNGILYRSVSYAFGKGRPAEDAFTSFAREIYSSANYAATQFNGLSVGKIYLGGYGLHYGEEIREAVASMTSIPIDLTDPWNVWEIKDPPDDRWGWDVVLGLALRGVDGK
jgi:type IV pilus assembly protein PilM